MVRITCYEKMILEGLRDGSNVMIRRTISREERERESFDYFMLKATGGFKEWNNEWEEKIHDKTKKRKE